MIHNSVRIAFLAVVLSFGAPTATTIAQQSDGSPDSNLSIATSLVAECVAPLIQDLDSFGYVFETTIRAVETGLVNTWLETGKSVRKLLDPISDESPYMHVDLQHMSVSYQRVKGKHLNRTIDIRLSALLFSNGEASNSIANCPGKSTDTISRSDISSVEDSSIPETMGTVPSRGIMRRYVQPIVVGAASAATVYLLFNVRSDEAGS